MNYLKLWHRILILSSLLLFLSLLGLRQLGKGRQASATAALINAFKRNHIALTLGPSSKTPEGLLYEHSTFVVNDDTAVRGTIERIVVASPLLGDPKLELRGVALELSGDPIDHYPVLQNLAGPLPLGLKFPAVDVKYTHPVFGELTLRGVTTESQDGRIQLGAREARLLDKTWQNISATVMKRGDFLEIGLNGAPGEPAKYQFVNFHSPAQGRVFTLRILHQPLEDVLEAFGWQSSPNLSETRVVASLTLVLGTGETVPRGSLQLTFDNWPKPPWQDAEALLGRSASLLARIAPVERPFDFKLPYVESTLPLYALIGTGVLKLFHQDSQLQLDLDGKQSCFKFSKNVAPSVYQSQTQGIAATSTEETALRVQLLGTASSSSPSAFASHLSANCGIPELSHGTFSKLGLPALEARRTSN